MADIRIEREHTLGMAQARKVATEWAEKAERKFDMTCTYQEGEAQDQLTFTRSGVNGTLAVTASSFELNARLGFLLSAFKDQIEGEIVKNLDTLMAQKPVAAAKKTALKKSA